MGMSSQGNSAGVMISARHWPRVLAVVQRTAVSAVPLPSRSPLKRLPSGELASAGRSWAIEISFTGTMLEGTPYSASSNRVASGRRLPLASSTRQSPPVYGADRPHQSMVRPAAVDSEASGVLSSRIDNRLIWLTSAPLLSRSNSEALAMRPRPPG